MHANWIQYRWWCWFAKYICRYETLNLKTTGSYVKVLIEVTAVVMLNEVTVVVMLNALFVSWFLKLLCKTSKASYILCLNIDLKEKTVTNETSASQLIFISILCLQSKSGYFYSVRSKLDKAEYAALIHARMCAYNYIFGYKSVVRFFLCFNASLVCYSPLFAFTLHV